jgi:hypothetical protein
MATMVAMNGPTVSLDIGPFPSRVALPVCSLAYALVRDQPTQALSLRMDCFDLLGLFAKALHEPRQTLP